MTNLSIIIPVYNTEKYLENCIESIVEYKGKDIEIILINDGSTDTSSSICEKYSNLDQRIIYINQTNKGCSYSRNIGIEKARGKYLWFVDGDDTVVRDSIEYILKILDNDIDLVRFGYNLVDKNYKKIGQRLPQKRLKKKFLISGTFASACNKIYKTEIIKENNIEFPLNTHMGEDLAFNLKYLYYAKKIITIEKKLYNYVNTLEGVTSKSSRRIEIFKAFDDIFNFYKNNKILKKNKRMLKILYKSHVIDAQYCRIILNKEMDKKKKLELLNKVNYEVKKRENIFKTSFYIYRKYFLLKLMIKNFLSKIKLVIAIFFN